VTIRIKKGGPVNGATCDVARCREPAIVTDSTGRLAREPVALCDHHWTQRADLDDPPCPLFSGGSELSCGRYNRQGGTCVPCLNPPEVTT
jgi:hypothetical protein